MGDDLALSIRDLSVDFPTEDGIVHAVRGVSFDLRPGEVLGIVGESGSGKSVTNLAVMGLLPPVAKVSGSAMYRGTELLDMRANELNRYRGKKIVMVFQDPMTSLNPVYKVGEQIAEAVRVHNEVSRKEALARAIEMLALVGIPSPRARAGDYPHEFSGGMRQRAMIAMAMVNDPDVIIADEPTTALDVTIQAQILETLVKVQHEFNSSVILITHDLGVVASMADRVLVMYAGRVVEVASVDQLFDSPRMPYTLGLLGSLPRIDSDGTERLVPIVGAPPSLVNLPPGCPFQPRCPLARELCNEVEPILLRTDSETHLSACHYWPTLAADVKPEEVFEVTAVDDALPEEYAPPGGKGPSS